MGKGIQEVKSQIPGAKQFEGKLGESAETLFKALQYQDQLLESLGKLYAYSHMRYDQIQRIHFIKA